MYALLAAVLIIFCAGLSHHTGAAEFTDKDLKDLYVGLVTADDILHAMRPRTEILNIRVRRFHDTVKNIASLVRLQESLPISDKTSLTGIIRGQIIQDSCAWLQSVLVGYDAHFNCTLMELERLRLRIDLQRKLRASLIYLSRSDTCADNACGFDLEEPQVMWIEDTLPCGEATEARNALYEHFGTILEEEKHISIQPCPQSI